MGIFSNEGLQNSYQVRILWIFCINRCKRDSYASHRNINYLPTRSCSLGFVFGRIMDQISIVKSVEAELKMDVRSLMRADSMTESMIPRIPLGMYSNTSFG